MNFLKKLGVLTVIGFSCVCICVCVCVFHSSGILVSIVIVAENIQEPGAAGTAGV